MELHVDLGDLQNEKENLTSFLQLRLKVSVFQVGDKLKALSGITVLRVVAASFLSTFCQLIL
jgi:hypothetical protein